MGPKRKPKNDIVSCIIFPFPKRTRSNSNNFFNDPKNIFDDDQEELENYNEYDDEYEEDYGEDYDDEETEEDDDEDDDEDDEESEEDDDDVDLEDDEETFIRKRNNSKENKTLSIKSSKWISDEFNEETNKIFIEKGIRLKIKVNLNKLWGDSNKSNDLTTDEIEILNNNMMNSGIIIFDKIYEENSKKKLSKILSKFDNIIDRIKSRESTNEDVNKVASKIVTSCNKIYGRFKREILEAKKNSDFDLLDFIISNYDTTLYDTRISDKFNDKYKSIDIDMDTKKHFKRLTVEEKKQYYDKMENILANDKDTKSLYLDTLNRVGIDDESKITILKKIKECENADQHDSNKLESWLQKIKSVPFGEIKKMEVNKHNKPNEIKNFLINGKKCLDDSIYGQEKVKNDIMRIMGKFVMNDCSSGNVIALEGPPGIGKTELIKNGLAKAMGLPCAFVPLGGLTDSSYLHGHDYTYTGSDFGKIIETLRQTKHMNPIIFFDELDKVSKCHKGNEIMNIMMQLTDPTQNDQFQDKYFKGVNFDLSKCLIIFSFNSRENISSILLNRMNIIRIPSLKDHQKTIIAKNFLIPKIMKESKIDNFNVQISDDLIKHVAEKYTSEGGVRKLKDRLNEIILEINIRKLMGKQLNNKFIGKQIILTKEMIDDDLLKDRYKYDHNRRCKTKKVGKVNGMWANDLGVGGLMSIQCDWVPSEKKLSLELTGLQGKTMRESMSVAKTVAWKLIPENIKKELFTKWKDSDSYGIHIHCPDGGTPKDGPSAGNVITCALVSLFTGIKCNDDVSMTGEIDINGDAKAIGGLDNKLYGAKREGMRLSLYPEENQRDIDDILKMYPDLVDDTFQIKSYRNVYEAMGYILESQLEWEEI